MTTKEILLGVTSFIFIICLLYIPIAFILAIWGYANDFWDKIFYTDLVLLALTFVILAFYYQFIDKD